MGKMFITGDVHSAPLERLSFRNFSIGKTLTMDDVVIITGDFGVLFSESVDAINTRNYILKWMGNLPYTILFIGGNHENWDTLNSLPIVEKYGVSMGEVCENVFFIPNGTIFEFGGKKIFCMGGAMSTDKDWRIAHERDTGEKIWWENEVPSKDEMQFGVDNLNLVDWKVNLVITHTMPSECIEDYAFKERKSVERTSDPTARYLNFIQKYLTYDKWYCGHFHVNQKYTNRLETKVVQVLYDYIINPDDEPLKNYGRFYLDPLW